jgi:hypothetical protein
MVHPLGGMPVDGGPTMRIRRILVSMATLVALAVLSGCELIQELENSGLGG